MSYWRTMSRRTRWLLALLGLLLVVLSVVALVYALAPLETVREQIPLAPELFRGPESWLPWR